MSPLRTLIVVACLFGASEAFTGGARGRTPKSKVAKKSAPQRVAKRAPTRPATGVAADIGVTPPLGLLDPLGFLSRGPVAYRRFQEMEIKHGRLSMAACLGIIVTEAGIRFPGYISFSQDLTFADVPGTLDGSYFGIPLAGWAQIVAFVGACDGAVFRQDPKDAPGDVVGDLPIEWVRYDDPAVKTFKLNAERNNGRAAMLGITGMIAHTALGQDALFPIVSN